MSHIAEDIMASKWSRPKVSKVSHNMEALAIMGSQGESQLSMYSSVEAVLSLYGLLHDTKMSHKIKYLASKARRESKLFRGRGLKVLQICVLLGGR
jgi:hypothetical protein